MPRNPADASDASQGRGLPAPAPAVPLRSRDEAEAAYRQQVAWARRSWADAATRHETQAAGLVAAAARCGVPLWLAGFLGGLGLLLVPVSLVALAAGPGAGARPAPGWVTATGWTALLLAAGLATCGCEPGSVLTPRWRRRLRVAAVAAAVAYSCAGVDPADPAAWLPTALLVTGLALGLVTLPCLLAGPAARARAGWHHRRAARLRAWVAAVPADDPAPATDAPGSRER